MKNNIYKIGVKKAARRMALGCLLLFAFAGSLVAQNDTPFVIKKDGNYLAHVKVGENYVLQNAGTFNPGTCLWYSGPTYNPTGYTHNYYFEDDAHNLRFLAAPLAPNGTLSLSSSLPSVSMLRNTDQVYYFYNWDPETYLSGVPEGGGVARGHRYYVNSQADCQACGYGATWYETDTTNHTFQCWEVYWIEYKDSQWKLSSASSYNITDYSAHYRKVTVTEHEKDVKAGGLTTLTAPTEMNSGENSPLSAPVVSPYSYIPAYTNYVFLEGGAESVHNYWSNEDHLTSTPSQVNDVTIVSKSYQWTISGDGEQYLSFESGSDVNTTTSESPTLYYRVPNNTGHKTATITVTVTYTDANNAQTTQTLSATVLVKTPCQNPLQTDPPVVTYVGVTVSWVATADKYKVDWKKQEGGSYGTPVEVIGASSYTITGLDYDTKYDYRVTAYCGDAYLTPPTSPTGTFKTKAEPGLMVYGAIFGGGRMANVGGKTEIVVVNCDTIGNIFGGNDIAGEVVNGNGSTIMLGVNTGNTTAYGTYGGGKTSDTIKFGSVYGGGNGYYAYNGESFVAASSSYTEETVAVGDHVNAMTPAHTVGDVVWTNTGTSAKTLKFPKIVKTAITVSNDYVKADSIFGGAKNAFLTLNSGNGSTITIDGGTIMAVFGGNNFGGGQGYGLHYIEVNRTKTKLALDIQNTATSGYGRNFGIRYLFGGGNKVYGSTTDIRINGGQCDNVFGGGNSADVYRANVTVNCSLGAYSSEHPYTYGNTLSNAIPTSYSGGDISIKNDYAWNGKGIYNVRNLYGGNNMEAMASVPTVTLTSGSVGTVYGGGNAGDMLAYTDGGIDEDGDNVNDFTFKYSTSVTLNSANMIVDYIYGGCRMSNVDYSTWVKINNGHVGTAFGGCNVSGDVGSTRVYPDAATQTAEYQVVQGGTYVEASGGTVYKNLFAGSNGFYHCSENFHYVSGINYTSENYVGTIIPTHNETHAIVKTGATVKGNVYAGGNMAPVGFRDHVASYFPSFPNNAVGWAVVHIYGGTVEGNVFGGGNMADVYGNNDVLAAGGSINALYGGNDRTGQVAEYSNRVLSSQYQFATDGHTKLVYPAPEVHAYVRVTGSPTIQEVYGGGNGDYDYIHGDETVPQYCNAQEAGPIQSNTFVDINIDGGSSGGHIGTVYGGGDGVTASGFITVLLNINEPGTPEDHDNVGVVFGGNNKGDLALTDAVPDIILLHGQVGTVYGGCNEGGMTGSAIITSTDGTETYNNVGSLVRLRRRYTTSDDYTAYPSAVVSQAVYGGCRMNGVTYNSLVLVEGGNFLNTPIFGGSDISGTVSGRSQVVVRDDVAAGSGNGIATIVGNVIGGGNGNYDYVGHDVYIAGSDHNNPDNLVATSDNDVEKPYCASSGVDMISGTAANLYAGGNACGSGTTLSNVEGGTVTTGIYGGSNASGNISGAVVVNINGGNIGTDADHTANIHGGGYGASTTTTGNVTVNVGAVDAASASATPTIYGAVYGGSALGSVNSASNTTTVNFMNGTLHGNVYGGGLGAATLDGNGYIASVITEAIVNGTVQVNIGNDAATDNSKYLNIDGKVFGGNNLAGTPKGNVYVDVYRTAHTAANTYPTSFPDPLENSYFDDNNLYALTEVYGGGNLAHYVPTTTDASANVHIHNCDNTIQYVYGSGNAANVPAANVTIDGGLIKYVFGGGNGFGEGNPGANVLGDNTLNLNGGVMGYVFGGSNTKGGVQGETTLTFRETPYCSVRSVNELYGGGNQAPDVDGIVLNVPCGISGVKNIFGGAKNADVGANGSPANIVLNVYGGDESLEAVFGGNNVGGTVWGNITLNLYGGTIKDAFGGNNAGGFVKGAIQVNVNDQNTSCPLHLNTVYGGGKDAAYAPTNPATSSPEVNILNGTVNNAVYGGGKGSTATVTANPKVTIGDNVATHKAIVGANLNGTSTMGDGNVYGGGDAAAVVGTTWVIYKDTHADSQLNRIFGGGNEAGVTGSTKVDIENGLVNTGVFGGCNTTGNISVNTTVTLTGGTIGATGLGNGASVHGGGYGHLTSVAGNVTVNFGVDDDLINNNLILYGDLYGGSALGTVNTDNHNTTTVNVYSGTIEALYIDPAHPENNVYGNVFGGGLGNADHPAAVNGKVVVNIGLESIGKASLVNCNVFGCNNQNGSPQDDVFVNIYQTAHTEKDEVGYLEMDRTYAIYQVFGGGNLAHYAPADSDKKTTVHVYNCDNTSRFVYGGGNAADAVGVVTVIEGGRFDEVYGGGNGRVTAANIGTGGIGLAVLAGNISFLFEGSNKEGDNAGPYYTPGGYSTSCLGGLFVDSYFFGTNEAELYHDLNNIITCAEAGNFEYRYVFAGSRWGIVYGDISLTVCGGIIENLFGGCRGYTDYSADVRRFPTFAELNADYALPEAERKYSQELRNYMGFDPSTYNPAYPHAGEPSYVGHGGNINLIVEGGIIGNVFGGCDIKGNVEGKISVTVCDDGDAECPFFVGNVYGASNQWYHDPENSTINSPDVKILKGTIGGTDVNLPVNNIYGAPATAYEGNVFGGGNLGHVTSNPVVIIGDGTTGSSATPVNVKGNVYGGGNLGDVTGNSQVIVVPKPHSVTYTASPTGGTITVKNGLDQIVSSGSNVGEGIDLYLMATPDISGYRFVNWTVNNGTVAEPNAAKTVFTMGTGDATISATFEPIASHSLTFSAPTGGSMIVGDNLTSSQTIGVGVVLSLSAIPDVTHKFSNWTVTGTGSSVTSSTSATTNFTMGTENTEIAAVFAPIELEKIHTLTLSTPSNGTYTVTDRLSNPVSNGASIGEGTILNLSASPSANYAFIRWTVSGAGASIANVNNPTTTFTMGTENATITAVFASVHEFTFSQPEHGTVKVTDVLGHVVNSGDKIGEGAMLNLKATPATGYAFQQWTATNGTIPTGTANAPISTFTMGTSNTIATVTATFVTAHTLTITTPVNGTVKVTSSLGQNITSGASIGVGAVLELVATPADGYTFTSWTVTGGTLNTSVIPNTFTMGSTDATITATFTVTP